MSNNTSMNIHKESNIVISMEASWKKVREQIWS